jgi:hypothetical protein
MPRRTERKKIIHEPSTQEILYCLSSMPQYLRVLSEQEEPTPFTPFLNWLISVGVYHDRTEKITVKKIAQDYGGEVARVTRWIKDIYAAVFDYNAEHPQRFQDAGVKVTLYLMHYDSACMFSLSLATLPREYEKVNFAFAKAKVGTDNFWVKKVEHDLLDSGQEVIIWLEGSSLNKYREYALQKALFHQKIGYMETYDLPGFELDKRLKEIDRQ